MDQKQVIREEAWLIRCIESNLKESKKIRKADTKLVIFHQDAFGADYQMEEYLLLGMYIKYLGIFGKEIQIIGKNRETLKKKKKKI